VIGITAHPPTAAIVFHEFGVVIILPSIFSSLHKIIIIGNNYPAKITTHARTTITTNHTSIINNNNSLLLVLPMHN
jgi:hypothetical protein